ncbi:putative F-box protein At1g19160 [Lycium barbarum]|uniref:putative F-box protein At1g19160 n=1 Tax=Lycium barbarum TaxID=112863 RepID=UPI00293F121C|nr:putative F-box protein At1g19160 [Lycium barbarum]
MKFLRKVPAIPREIIFEVFSWLPVKSLTRFRCVSKICNSLVSELDFVNIHQCRSVTRPGGTKLLAREKNALYIIEQDGVGKASFLHIDDFDELCTSFGSTATNLECVNGLFCCWRTGQQPILICNPSTRKVRFLPSIDVNHVMCHYSFGFEPEEKVYKVLFTCIESFTNGYSDIYTRNWVFTLGGTNISWKEIENIPQFYCFTGGVCINGVICLLNGFHRKKNIVAFDLKTESSRAITLWEALHHTKLQYNLMEVKGKLAILENKKNGEFNLWILEKDQHEEWERHIIIGFPLVYKEMKFHSMHFCPPTYDGEIIFVDKVSCKKFSYLSYDITRKTWRKRQVKGLLEKYSIEGIYRCVESLFPLKTFCNQV